MKTLQVKFRKEKVKSDFRLLKLFVTLSIVLNGFILLGQVAINEDDSDGNTNTELDIKSTTKGVIFPVMTTAERDAIPSPAEGLLIFNRSGGYHNYYNGTLWQQIDRNVVLLAINPSGAGTDIGVGVGVADPDNSAILHVNSTTKGFLLPRVTSSQPSPIAGHLYYNTLADKIIYYNGSNWNEISTTASIAGAGGASTAEGVLIGSGTIAASAKMEVRTTTNKGLLLPRMTDAQRDAIDSPAEGLTIYNTTANNYQYFSSATWYSWADASLTYGVVIGNPGLSCKDIYDSNSASQGVDGVYYIDPDGVGANPAYACTCDMTTDGGGWTLVENTGPKNTNNPTTASSGISPIPSTVGSAFAKLSDADINLIRDDYSTSIMRVERSNGAFSGNIIYFKQNRVFNSTAANNTTSIITYFTSYANAISNTSIQTGTANYGSAFDSWSGGTVGYRIIFRYAAEGIISDGATNTCGGTGTNNRSECNALVWVKKP
ncbi:MAG: fibrinogen-like YCDxxxxGGGW domain-containing protein [Salinivirgaceae bacterium]|jgi:hypothetical protein